MVIGIIGENCTGKSTLAEEIHKRFGGEIVTVGSDAHTPETAAKCVREGYAVLRACGFGYVTVFRQRKPAFLRLS